MDFLSAPWERRGRLYRYIDREFADAFVNGGVIRISRAGAYRDEKVDGIKTPDEVRHSVSFGFPPGVIGSNFATGFGGLYVTNCTDQSGKFIPFATERNWEMNHLVLCFSNSLDLIVRNALGKGDETAAVRILRPDELFSFLTDKLGCKSHFGEVKYTDAPDRNAFTKGLDTREQREVRMAWDFPGDDEFIEVALPEGFGEYAEMSADQSELLEPYTIITGGMSLGNFCARGNGVAKISAIMAGDKEWMAQLESETPCQPNA